jgi:hypothetical protein
MRPLPFYKERIMVRILNTMINIPKMIINAFGLIFLVKKAARGAAQQPPTINPPITYQLN